MSRSFGVRSLTTRSPILISPSLISSRPASIRSAVVFPQPDGPTSTISSPSPISRLKSCTARVPSGYTFATESYAISAMRALFFHDYGRVRRQPVAVVGCQDDLAPWRGAPLRAGIDRDRVLSTPERHDSGLRVEQAEAASERAAQLEQLPIELEQRAGIAALFLDITLLGVDERQPRTAGRESTVRVPLHRVAQAVPTGTVEGRFVPGAVREPELVALVDESGARQRQQEHRRGTEVLGTDSGREPVEVVARHHPGGSPKRGGRLDRGSQPLGIPGGEEELEGEDEVEHLEPGLVLADRPVELAHEQRVARGLAQRPQRLDRLGPVARVTHLQLRGPRIQRQRKRLARGRVVPQLLVLHQSV